MRPAISIIIVFLLLISCAQSNKSDDAFIVKVKDKTLLKSDLEKNIPVGILPNDSVVAAEHYIRTWITDVLMYDVAAKNINDMTTINRMVEDYRKSLVIYQYQEQLIDEKLSKNITDHDLQEYYNSNREKFRTDKYSTESLFTNPADAPVFKDIIPFEYAKPIVREMLVNQRRIEFLGKMEDDIYQRALDRGEIQFFND